MCDVSFISVRTALPPLLRLAAPGWEALVLVKPQFEAGRADAPKGVVRDPEVRRRVLRDVCAAASAWGTAEHGCRVVGVVDSGLPGPKGNREFLVHLIDSPEPTDADELERWIDDAVGVTASNGRPSCSTAVPRRSVPGLARLESVAEQEGVELSGRRG